VRTAYKSLWVDISIAANNSWKVKMVNKRVLVSVICLAALSTTAQASSISAESLVCYGYFGSASNPQPACAPGNAGGGGGVVIGGSGVGSGINIPFQTNSSNSEFSASAAALQDYGIFRGYAHVHVTDQNPGIFGGGAGAQASGEFIEMLTINGGTGQGRLNLGFTLTGSGSANVFSSGGTGTTSGQADLAISVRLNDVFGGAIVANRGGTYDLPPDGPNALLFTFGVPFKLSVVSVVSAGGGYDRYNPPIFFQADADASFEHTAILSSIAASDIFGNKIPNISLIAESGTHYPLTAPDPTVVPIPGGFPLFGFGAASIGLLGRRRKPA
jgi:hypothetical protein